MKLRKSIILLPLILFVACQDVDNLALEESETVDSLIVYSEYSEGLHDYENFNSQKAINHIADIENEYFYDFKKSYSKFYGTVWRSYESVYDEDNEDLTGQFHQYRQIIEQRGERPDSMHCTIYAIKAIKAGLSNDQWNELDSLHRLIYKDHEHAGWSIAYILTKYFDWKAYLFVSQFSEEYQSCVRNFKKDGKYHVWRQPDIEIEELYLLDDQKLEVDSLLQQYEFGWGFSNQGWHTWITRFDTLKECLWNGSPSIKYDSAPLFNKIKFTEYFDYHSHIVVLPNPIISPKEI